MLRGQSDGVGGLSETDFDISVAGVIELDFAGDDVRLVADIEQAADLETVGEVDVVVEAADEVEAAVHRVLFAVDEVGGHAVTVNSVVVAELRLQADAEHACKDVKADSLIDAYLEFRHTVEVDGEVVEAVVFALLAVHLDAGLFGVLGADGVIEGRLSFNVDLAGEVERKHEIRIIADRGDAVADGQRPLEQRDRSRVLVGIVGESPQLLEQILDIGDLVEIDVRAKRDGRGHIVGNVRGDVEIFADRVNVDIGIELDSHVVVQVDREVCGLSVNDDDVGNGDRDVDHEHAVDQLDVGIKLRRGLEDVDDSHAKRALAQLLLEILFDDDHALVGESGGRRDIKFFKHFGEFGLGISYRNDAVCGRCRSLGLERSLRTVVVLENENLTRFEAFAHAHQSNGAFDDSVFIGLFLFQFGILLFGIYDLDAINNLNSARLLSNGEHKDVCVGIFNEISIVIKLDHDRAVLGPTGLGSVKVDNVFVARIGYRYVIDDLILTGRRFDRHAEIGDPAVDLKRLLSGKTTLNDGSAVNGRTAATASVVHTGVTRGTVAGVGSDRCVRIDRLFSLIVGTCHKHRQRHSEHKHERYAKQKSVLPHNHFLRNRFSYTRIRRV